MGEKRFTGPGKLIWHDLLTPDVEGAVRFYGQLFGWSFKEIYRGRTGMQRVFGKSDRELGAFLPLEGDPGGGSLWLPCSTVESVDEAVQNAVLLGGQVVTPPLDLSGLGRRAVVEDPSGALLALLSDGDEEESLSEGPPEAGTFIWNDLLSRDPGAAGEFLCGLVGWQLFTMDLGPQGTYYLLKRGEVNEAGIIVKPEGAAGPSQWIPYAAVEDLEEACVKTAHLGGAIHHPPSDLHGAGTYAVAGDPAGAVFALFQPR